MTENDIPVTVEDTDKGQATATEIILPIKFTDIQGSAPVIRENASNLYGREEDLTNAIYIGTNKGIKDLLESVSENRPRLNPKTIDKFVGKPS